MDNHGKTHRPTCQRLRLALGFTLALACATGHAASASGSPVLSAEPPVPILDTMVVSGVQPGPGMWRVHKGGHSLWILGTVSPVPRRMEWMSRKAESVLATTQEIIEPPAFVASMGVGSMLKAAFAMPTMMRARKLPEGQTLRDVLPADLYARWTVQKAAYLGPDKSMEEWRPIFAAGELYGAALKRAGLEMGSGVGKRVEKIARQRKIKRTSTTIRVEISNPRQLAKSFHAAKLDEVPCFRSVLDRLDRDVNEAALRGNAWAVGNLAELARLTSGDKLKSCLRVLETTEAAQTLGLVDIDARMHAQWVAAAKAALESNSVSFATLPVAELLHPGDKLAALQAMGYRIEAPP